MMYVSGLLFYICGFIYWVKRFKVKNISKNDIKY